MLNVKVATDKEGERIWDLQGAVPFGCKMQNPPEKCQQRQVNLAKRPFDDREDRV